MSVATETISDSSVGLLEQLLMEQQLLTAVDCFVAAEAKEDLGSRSRYHSMLLPASPPGEGQQYGFEVDLDRCSGCKACVTACHSQNALGESETWREVGLLVGGSAEQPVMQHVTSACHHCLEPACQVACPVDAYQKDPVTGIVGHDADACFGCQYCILACPYEVPKFSNRLRIVRKCDMCSDRLAVGEAPACVQGCPHQAITIRLVDVRQVVEDSESDSFLPAAPDPHLTLPTTTYKSSRPFPRNMLPVDYRSVSPGHAPWSLILMLVLTQLSVGAFTVGMLLESWLEPQLLGAFRPVHATSSVLFGLLALAASVFHLGRPHRAYRAIIGLKHSWLSREILSFGVFAGLACLFAMSTWSEDAVIDHGWWLGWSVAVTGGAGVLCSTMIYVFTRRDFWNFGATATRFGLTSVVLGMAASWLSILLLGQFGVSAEADRLVGQAGGLLARGLLVVMTTKLVFEALVFRHLLAWQNTPLQRSARLMVGDLSNITMARFACGFLGGIAMTGFLLLRGEESNPGFSGTSGDPLVLVCGTMLFAACLGGELLERFLFFAAASPRRMPGSLGSARAGGV